MDAHGFITASASRVLFINGGNPCKVFWQVTSSGTLGSGSTFGGTIMPLTSITMAGGVTVNGRVLARNGDVTLNNDIIHVDVLDTHIERQPFGQLGRQLVGQLVGHHGYNQHGERPREWRLDTAPGPLDLPHFGRSGCSAVEAQRRRIRS